MKDSVFLKKVKTNVTQHHETWPLRPAYICWAINDTPSSRFTLDQRDKLKTWIQRMLGDCASLEKWLFKHHKNRKTYTRPYLQKTYEARIAWIDWMINHLEEQGL